MDNPNIRRDLECYEDAIKTCAEKQSWQTVEFDTDFVRESFEELLTLRAENARLRGALQWYAGIDNWPNEPERKTWALTDLDNGYRAREALAPSTQPENVSKNSELK